MRHNSTPKSTSLANLWSASFEMGIEMTLDMEELLSLYLDELRIWNTHINLTSRAALADAERVHLIDSIRLIPLLKDKAPDARYLIDVGSGAGLPGLVLKIFLPQITTYLLEAVGKKARFLRAVIDRLGLKGVEVVEERAETAAHRLALRNQFDVAVARALGPMAVVAELSLPFLREGGILLAPRGKDIHLEIENSRAAVEMLGAEYAVFSSWIGTGERTIGLVQRKNAPSAYPRRVGIPAKRPLARSKHGLEK